MKIQCSCGAKYAFDATPEMARSPVKFLCQSCGQDNSDAINQLIRQQFGVPAPVAIPSTRPQVAPQIEIAPPPPGVRVSAPIAVTVAAAPTAVGSRPTAAPASLVPSPSGPAPAGLRVAAHATPAAVASAPAPASAAAAPTHAPQMCFKHVGQITTRQCLVCKKPMCPKCMEVFGYVCSAFCKGKAEDQGIAIPVYAGQRDLTGKKQWKRIVWTISIIAILIVGSLSAWTWYVWVGSVPKVAFSAKFSEAGYSGRVTLIPDRQMVALHGGTVVRHDIKAKKEVWSNPLVDKVKIAEKAKAHYEAQQAQIKKVLAEGGDLGLTHIPTLEEITADMERSSADAMRLHVSGQSIWVSSPEKVTQLDWQTGKATKEIVLSPPAEKVVRGGQELAAIADKGDGKVVTYVNMTSGESRTEEIGGTPAGAGSKAPGRAASSSGSSNLLASAKTAQATSRSNAPPRTQGLSTPARLARPAVVAANANQQRALAEATDPVAPARAVPTPNVGSAASEFSLVHAVPSKEGLLLMAAKPVAASRYQVSVKKLAGNDPGWTTEIAGYPTLRSLETVHVLSSGRTMQVLDRAGKKLWETQLEKNLAGGVPPESADFWASPGASSCVEHGDTLYAMDSDTLLAFDLASGNSRWKVSSQGIAGIYFDDAGAIYVNAGSPNTTGGDQSRDLVIKVDAKTGKTLWQADREGAVTYVSGKFVYTTEWEREKKEDPDAVIQVGTIFDVPAHIRIKRLDPATGRIMWSHYQKRMPLDVRFDKNSIQILFKKEMQNLKFLSL